MKSHSLKWFALLGLLLFLGVAVAPTIYADSEKVSLEPTIDIVDCTINFCGLNKNHTVQLTFQQTQEFYNIFNTMRNKLSRTNKREETYAIFEDAIYELDELGLLGDVSKSEALDLVFKQQPDEKFTTMTKSLSKINPTLLDSGNYFCSLVGNTENMYFSTPSLRILNIFMIIDLLLLINLTPSLVNIFLKANTFIYNVIDTILDTFPTIYLIANLYRFIIETLWSTAPWLLLPLIILMSIPSTILLGVYATNVALLNLPSFLILVYVFPIGFLWNLPFKKLVHHAIMYGWDVEGPSAGWVETVGINGHKSWNGSFWGQLPLLPHFVYMPNLPDPIDYLYPGVMGFRGIEMTIDENGYYYMGNALWVHLGDEKPDNPWIFK